jgi:hypothetical protein
MKKERAQFCQIWRSASAALRAVSSVRFFGK